MIHSFLVQGCGAALAQRLAPLCSEPLDALLLFSLGADHTKLIDAVARNNVNCPVFVSETYGILGFDEELNRHVELMEKERGTEYGCVGGSGGQGCLAVAYSGGGWVCGTDDNFPPERPMMVVSDGSGSWAEVMKRAPLHYGGITKDIWRFDGVARELVTVPYLWMTEKEDLSAGVDPPPTGISAFTGDAAEATRLLLKKLPNGFRATGSVGLFPCFTRGVNKYGAEDVESGAVSKIIGESTRIYGMFAHGELGPSSYSGFATDVTVNGNGIGCEQHGMTTILSVHTARK